MSDPRKNKAALRHAAHLHIDFGLVAKVSVDESHG